MKKYDIYFSLENDKDGRQLTENEKSYAIRLITCKALDIFGGYTLVESQGGYVYKDGSSIREKAYILTIFCDFSFGVVSICGYIKGVGFQESVLYTCQELEKFEIN
jgi:hypothetical protein